jgi:hypothetical protein
MRRFLRISIWFGGTALLMASVAGVLGFAFFQKFYPTPPKPDYPAPRNEAMAQRQDLDYFRHYLTFNQAYNIVSREKAQHLLAETEAKAGELSHGEFELAIARIVALADNGHSTVLMGSFSRLNNRLPCRLYRFADGYYVIRAHTGCVSLLGAKLIAIDGRSAEQVTEAMFRYSGGPKNHYDQFKSVLFLESPELLHAAGLANVANHVTLTVRMPDGLRREVMLSADPADPKAPRVYSDAFLSPEPIKGETKDWQPLLSRPAPLFLRDYSNPFHSHFWSNSGVYYVQFRANANENGHSISAFVSQVKQELAANKPRIIVLDLRLDQGGNLVSAADLMQRLPVMESVRHVYLLTSPWTFSAGLVSAAIVKHAGGDKVTIIGENVGDRLRFWAEGGGIVLPNSKLDIGFSTGLHDYKGSCWGEPGCFWLQIFIHPQVETLEPAAVVPYRFADYVRGRDPLLETALDLASPVKH